MENTLTVEGYKAYKELEEDVRNQMIDSIILNDNRLDGLAVLVQCRDGIAIQRNVLVSFNLNGEKYKIEIPIDRSFYESDIREKLPQLLFEEMAKKIAIEIAKREINMIVNAVLNP